MRSTRDPWQAFWRIGLVCALVLSGWTGWGAWDDAVAAHEIPADVTVHVFVKPEGRRLRLLVRAPLEAMRDVIFPTRDPGFLLLPAAGPTVRTAAELWLANGARAFEDGRRLGRPQMLAVQLSLPSDRSFDSWDQALAHTQGPPLPTETQLLWTQARLDVLLEFDIESDSSRFAIETDFARLGLRTMSVVRFLPAGGQMRVFQYSGDAGRLQLDPRWHQAALRFVESGVDHILGGIDHLLFLLCLVVPLRRLKPLVVMVTAFTVAHSMTLVAAAFGWSPAGLWFPPLVETLIALSIVWTALENIISGADGVAAHLRRRWALTFLFGLVHGFGFSFALRDTLQFGGAHFMTSLVSFNFGVELGQILALLMIVPALQLLFRYAVAERIGGLIMSALVAHHAWHWMMDRGRDLMAHGWPFTARETLALALRVAIVTWLTGGAWYWRTRRRQAAGSRTPSASGPSTVDEDDRS